MDNKISLTGTITWLICTLFFMYEFILRTLLGTFQFQVMNDLQLTAVQFAFLSTTMFQLVYGLMQIPIGMLIDAWGLKKTLLAATLLCTIATLGFSLTQNFIVAILFRMLMGLGASCGFICVLIAIYDWMPRKNIGLFIGISQFIATIGPMLAAGPLSSMLSQSHLSWRTIFSNLALIGGIISVFVFFYVNNNRQQTAKFMILSHSSSLFGRLGHLIKQKQIWLIAIYSASIYFSIEYLTENEGVGFLVAKGFSATFSSYMITLAWLGHALFCPLLGYLSDKTQRRTPFMYVSSIIMLVAIIGIIYVPLSETLLAICFILIGLGASSASIGFAIMADQCKENSLAAGIGINNTMIVVSSSFIAPLIGYVLSHASGGNMVRLGHYQEGFVIMVILVLVASFISMFWIKETFCKSTCTNTIVNPTNNDYLRA